MKKVISFSSIFLIAGLSLYSQYGHFKPANPFQTIKAGKAIRALSQFELVDDFNQGIDKSRRGGEWVTEASKKTKLNLLSVKEDPNKLYGSLLQIKYEIPSGEQAKASTKLFSLDVSKAEALAGRLKTESWSRFEGQLFVSLYDIAGHSAQAEISSFLRPTKNGWTDFVIPRKALNSLDFNHLDKIELIVAGSAKKPLSGVLEIDDITFYGPENLYFESTRDNIKSFPDSAENLKAKDMLKLDDKKLLTQIAKDTWYFFENSVDKNSDLVVDHIRLGRVRGIGNYTSTSNVAFYWLACAAAYDLGFISKKEAVERIDRSLKTVEKLERWRGSYFYNFYNTETLEVTRRYVSSVDNGWLAAALVVVRQAFPGRFDNRIEAILDPLNFSVFEDKENGQLRIGFDEDKNEFSPHHYGLLVSEARLTSYLAIGKGDLPKTHWSRIYRTAPAEWDWQNQIPRGKTRELFGVPVFEGYYNYRGKKIVPSWGGSLFEFLSPSLLLKEQELGKKGLGKNNIIATEAHINYALKEKQYPVWGIAPASLPNGKDWVYKEFGIRGIAVKGYSDSQVVTPYASILAINILPEQVIKNMREMILHYPDVYGPYGFYDAIETDRKKVNYQYLAIDQGMILVAVTNYLRNGSIQNWFHADSIGKAAEEVLTQEVFF